ncbi:MAG: nucleotide exchange factor GrpE [Clostridiales bacterium]|nr:nucleotide exchange factor GrpE [Candidatus Crickella merdequi]
MTEEMKTEAFEEEVKAEETAEAAAEEATETENAEAAEEKTEDVSENTAAEEENEEKDNEKYMRLLAEFQNFKKRAVKEKSDIHAYANEKIVGELLPVLDNFERALDADAASDPEAYAKGMSLIFEQMMTALVKAGLEEIEALGTEFDPNKHSAVMTQASAQYESGHVSTVLQKGYTLNKKVIRPAMVAVAE